MRLITIFYAVNPAQNGSKAFSSGYRGLSPSEVKCARLIGALNANLNYFCSGDKSWLSCTIVCGRNSIISSNCSEGKHLTTIFVNCKGLGWLDWW